MISNKIQIGKSFKIILTAFLCASLALTSLADEGMWIPLLLDKYNEADMQSKGLRLTAEDIYSVNQSSLKDAVVRFGGGCTGEVVSAEGLMLTNHHCGYSRIQSHSTVEKDYLTDGFWAMSREEELANPNLTVTFLVRMEDVTGAVLKNVSAEMTEQQRAEEIEARIKELEEKAVEGTHYDAKIKPFYYGTEFYLFITETFKDIRLVGAPPHAIGKFGGDTDNWMFPRHTGDFSVFRIYANKDNEPAEYSEDNVPYKPKHHFPISLKGYQEGDFTMVFGFPGRTEEYLTSFAIRQIVEQENPLKIQIREKRLDAMAAEMKKSAEVRLNYISTHASVSNYHKKWIGENRGIKKFSGIEKKETEEKAFMEWVNEDESRREKYSELLQQFEWLYDKIWPHREAVVMLNEAIFGIEILQYANRFREIETFIEKDETQSANEKVEKLKENASRYFEKYHQPIDRQVFEELTRIYFTNIDTALRPDIYSEVMNKFKGDFAAYRDHVFDKSIFASEEETVKFLEKFKGEKSIKKLNDDPAYKLLKSALNGYFEKIATEYSMYRNTEDYLMRQYVAALREKYEKVLYPDANSTLRLSYGAVETYEPRDAVTYQIQTTLEGVMQKRDPDDREFHVPEKLMELYEQKDYGKYGQNGRMPVCFIASNHTTGGNSGSPVLNGDGQLIGINFDRNWQGTMADYIYDPSLVRNISVDIRYVLFVIDKFANAGHLVDEMTLVE